MKLSQISDRTLAANEIERQTARNLARAGHLWWRRPRDPEQAGWIYAGPFGELENGGTLEAIEPLKASDEELRERRAKALARFDMRRLKRGRLRVRFNVGDFRANPVPLPAEAVGPVVGRAEYVGGGLYRIVREAP